MAVSATTAALPTTMRSAVDSASADSRRLSQPLEPGFVERMSTLSSGCAGFGHRRGHQRREKRSDQSSSLAALGTENTLGAGGSSTPDCTAAT